MSGVPVSGDPHAVARLRRLTGITTEQLAAEAKWRNLSVEQLAEAYEFMVYASAGRDNAAWAAMQMVRGAIHDLEMVHRCKTNPDGTVNADFEDFTSKEGAERRKSALAFGASARQNLSEARQAFLHASVLTQHIPAEEAARAKNANLPVTAEEPSTLTGPAARVRDLLQQEHLPKSLRAAARRQVNKLGEEIAKVEDEVEKMKASA